MALRSLFCSRATISAFRHSVSTSGRVTLAEMTLRLSIAVVSTLLMVAG
jgi:hypothetical protein